MDSIGEKIKAFIMKEFLPGEDADQLSESMPLISGGILDSLSTLKVVAFLEESFGITVAPHETDEDNFGSIADIERLVREKQSGS